MSAGLPPLGAATPTGGRPLGATAARHGGQRARPVTAPAVGAGAADGRLAAGLTRLASIGDAIGALAGFDTGASALATRASARTTGS